MSEEQAAGEKAWMDEIEKTAFAAFADEIQSDLSKHSVEMTPFLRLRTEWLATLVVLRKRNEDGLADASLKKPADPDSAKTMSILLDNLFKIWERMQKVMNDIEDHCAKAGTPIDKGLADKVKPLLQRTEGIIESLLAKEAPKTRKRAPKKSVDKSAVMDTIVGP